MRLIRFIWLPVLLAFAAAVRADAAPPNVVIILADDLGFSDLGCYGGEVDTPHLDRLAAGGLQFTQGYNTARCWPTRAALLTGYYAQAIRRDSSPGIQGGNDGHQRPAWARLLPTLLAPAGYRSYHSGKWHIDGDPREEGFAHSLQIEGGQNDFFDPAGITIDGRPIEAGDDFYVTNAVGDHASECLRDHAARHAGAPFFSYVAFTAPHFPLHAPQDVVAKYKNRYQAGWDALRQARFQRLVDRGIIDAPFAPLEPEVGPPYQPRPEVLATFGPGEIDRPRPWGELSPAQQDFQATKMAIHAAMVEMMDRAVGKIVGQLQAMHALDDTLILFLSDNGASAEIMIRGKGHDPALPPGASGTYCCLGPGFSSCANTPFRRHKTWVHEGGIATPWIVHWPRGCSSGGGLRTQPVHVIDVVPTVLALAGVAAAAEHDGQPVPPLQGASFAACLADPSAPPPHETLWWCHNGNRAVRVGDWKLVAAKDDAWELYDLVRDRTETTNLAGRQPDRVAAMEKVWTAINERCRELAELDGGQGRPSGKQAATPKAASSRPAKASLAGRRPNIIYVMTDDQGYGDIASHGNPILETPHLDRLRDESVRFTEFHVSPTCAPTRAALLTGRHEFRSGITHTIDERERLAPSATTLPQLLKSAGYTSGIFGKWHLGDEDAYQPGRRGFDRVFIHGAGGIGQSFPGSCGDVPGNTYMNPIIRSDGTFVETKGYCTDVFFREAESWIEACHKKEQPFFCSIATNAPHAPYIPPSGGREKTYREALAAAGITNDQQVSDAASFFAMIENIDGNMGRLLRKLDDLGIADDTLVVFSTDNGTAAGARVFNDGMRAAKGSPYRGGTRVPAFWRWKGTLPAGVDVPSVTAHIDVLPTLCEIAGATIPPAVAEKVEGRSLVPLLKDAAAAWPDRPLVTHVGRWDRGQAAASAYRNCRLREGKWSLVNTKNRPDAWELYDVASDPGEQTNLAALHPDVVRRMVGTYDAWWQAVQPDLVNENVAGPAENPFTTAYWEQFGPRPTLIDVPYGEHPKQKMHFWKSPAAAAGQPTPLLFFVHGGGWQGGDRMSGLAGVLEPVLDAGISVASVEYRFISEAIAAGIEPPVKAPLTDAARALQTVRSKAAEWGIDKERIVAAGGSAGACSSLWLAFHDDMADPGSSDPVARESTRLLAAAVSGAQTTLDPAQMKEWTPNSRYGGHAFGFMPSPEQRDSQFAQFLAARDKILPWIEEYSPYALVTPDDPPIALFYSTPPALGQEEKDPTHTANFGVKLEERLEAVGVPCELVYPGAPDVKHPTLTEAVTGFLKPVPKAASRPNILSIIADDQSPFDLTCYNPASTLDTPVIARLAAEGMVFDAAYHGDRVMDYLAEWERTQDTDPFLIYLGFSHPHDTRDGTPELLAKYGATNHTDPMSLPPADWKLIKYESPSGGLHTQLFNLRDNPQEFLAEHHDPAVVQALATAPQPTQKNLATDPAHSQKRVAMEALLLAEMQRHDDPFRFSDQRRPEHGQARQAAAAARPNIVLFLADDLGYGELGCYGNQAAITPNLDRFAAEGLKLTDCHSASSVCSPSRSSLLTGRTPYRNGVFTWIPEKSPIHLRTSEIALPKLLKEAGYQTCHVGKWHLNGMFNAPEQPQPSDHGYDWWLATQNNAAPSHAFPENFVRNGAAIGKVDDYSAPFIAQEATAWLKEKRDANKPFFLAVWTHEPHYPIASAERYQRQHAHIGDLEERTYRANITQLDDAFGSLMKTLDEIGATDSTLVFFTSDNGPEGAGDTGPGRGLAGPLRGRKRSMYEGGHRVPGIVRWPGKIEPGTQSDLPVIGSDFFPTALAAAGLDPPAGVKLDGVDISGPRLEEIRPLFWRWGGYVAYREGPWKVVVPESMEKPELYDLAADPAETRDVAAREPDRLAALMARLRAYTAEVEAEGPAWWQAQGWNGPPKKKPASVPGR